MTITSNWSPKHMNMTTFADTTRWPMTHFVIGFIKQASPRTRLLAGIWLLFLLLVVFGIHGSSTGVTAGWWMPERPYSAYLFGLSPQAEHQPSGMDFKGRQAYLLATARQSRWDELAIFT